MEVLFGHKFIDLEVIEAHIVPDSNIVCVRGVGPLVSNEHRSILVHPNCRLRGESIELDDGLPFVQRVNGGLSEVSIELFCTMI